VLRRDAGTVGLADLLLLVIIADAAQNAMAGSYDSVSDGFILVATLVFWNFLLDYLGFKFPAFERLVVPRRLSLVRHGRLLRANMRREFLTEEELMAKIRERGIAELSQVKLAYMEADGKISVIPETGRGPK
jgi:uncharacterized membrane protein YcaP (DUF421 family)